MIYSLIETAKETGLDPYRYLVWALGQVLRLAQNDGDWAERLTPDRAPGECRAT